MATIQQLHVPATAARMRSGPVGLAKGSRVAWDGITGTVSETFLRSTGIWFVAVQWDVQGVMPRFWLSVDNVTLAEPYDISSELMEGEIDGYSY
jgi:hypothetical protein